MGILWPDAFPYDLDADGVIIIFQGLFVAPEGREAVMLAENTRAVEVTIVEFRDASSGPGRRIFWIYLDGASEVSDGAVEVALALPR